MYNQPSPIQQLLGNRRLLLIGGGIVLVLLIGISLLTFSGGDDGKTDLQRLSVRYTNLITITSTSTNQIRSDELAKFNSEANLLFNSDNASLTNLLKTKFSVGEIQSDIQKAEADTSSSSTLQQAALLDHYDSQYKKLMDEKLVNLQSLIDSIRAKISATQTISILSTARANTVTLRQHLQALKL